MIRWRSERLSAFLAAHRETQPKKATTIRAIPITTKASSVKDR
jgi:hypothetical protein